MCTKIFPLKEEASHLNAIVTTIVNSFICFHDLSRLYYTLDIHCAWPVNYGSAHVMQPMADSAIPAPDYTNKGHFSNRPVIPLASEY
jgi:hypothetical protein